MPPKKTTTKKTTTRKPAAKKAAPKRKPTAKKPAAKRNYRRKKPDRKLPITTLLAIIPIILLTAFVVLRFSGDAPPPVPVKEKEVIKQTVVKEIEKRNVIDTVKLFMFENSLKGENLIIEGNSISIKAESIKLADALKSYLEKSKITVDGENILTAEDQHGIYNISFVLPKPKPEPKPVQKPKPLPVVKKKYKAKLAVVIDDCGYSLPLARQLVSIDYPVTLAVLPFTPYGKETAILTRKAGKTLFLHFPMQPKSYPKFDPGKGALFLNMPESVISAVTKANFDYFPIKLDGANNHTGSAFTESSEKMTQALRQIKKYTNTFMDSYTSGRSVAYNTCQKMGMECAVNNIFLDNEEPGLVTITDKQNHVHDQLVKAARKALRKGSAIAIGHLKKGTVTALEKSFRDIEKMGVQIVPVKTLMN